MSRSAEGSRHWFVGDAGRLAAARVPGDDVLVPLDMFQRAELGSRAVAPPGLDEWEHGAVSAVLEDLAAMVSSMRKSRASSRWLRYRDYDLSAALAKPDHAFLGMPRQLLAHRVATRVAPTGEVGTVGVNRFQRAGLEAALGRPLRSDRVETRAAPASPRTGSRLRELFRSLRAGWAARSGQQRADIMYLGLEPHVVRQQERILSTLAAEHRIVAVLPLRQPWPWPEDTSFRPASVRSLSSYLGPGSLARLAGAAGRNGLLPPARALRVPPWMSAGECRRWLRREWWRGAVLAEGLASALRFHRPRLLIGTNLFSQAGKVTTGVCAREGVPALGLPSGADQMIPPHVTASDVGQATYVVAGDALKDLLVAGGAAPDRLVVCGLPELDTLAARPSVSREELMHRHGLDPARPLVTFFSSPSLENEQLMFPTAAKLTALDSLIASRERLGVELLVKLHPRESDGAIARHLAGRGAQVPVCIDLLPEVMAASDVVASIGSAVTFTAILLGKPALLLHFDRAPLLSEVFRFTGVGIAPGSPQEVPEAIARALAGSAEAGDRAFVRDWLAGADGRSSERITALAKRLLG